MEKGEKEGLQTLLREIIARAQASVTLDDLAEAMGNRPITAAGVEWLISELEIAGVSIVDGEVRGMPQLLSRVLSEARALKARGESPSPANIARGGGMSARAVRVALLYAEVISGPRRKL